MQAWKTTLLVAATIAVGGNPTGLVAQEASARESVLCFERQRESYPARLDVECPDGVVPAPGILLSVDSHPPELVENVLDELAELVLTTGSDVVRRDAVQWLAFLGRSDRPDATSYRSGIVPRLGAVYDRADGMLSEKSARLTKRMVLDMMGKQSEAANAAAFLEEVARRPPRHRTSEPMALLAVKALKSLGPVGAASLERLRSEGQAPHEP